MMMSTWLAGEMHRVVRKKEQRNKTETQTKKSNNEGQKVGKSQAVMTNRWCDKDEQAAADDDLGPRTHSGGANRCKSS